MLFLEPSRIISLVDRLVGETSETNETLRLVRASER